MIKIHHYSRTLLVQDVASPELIKHKGIQMYLIADLRPCGKVTVGTWTDAWNAIQIDEERVG